MNVNVPGCRWERRVPPTTRDTAGSQPASCKKTLHILALLSHNHTLISLIIFKTLVKYSLLPITDNKN